MRKFILNSLVTAVALGGTISALAIETGASVNATTTVKKPQPVKAMMEVRRDIKENRASTTNAIKNVREETREKIQDLKNKISSTTEVRKDRLASTSLLIKGKREEIRDKFASTTQMRREKMREFLKKHFEKMLKRIEATIQRQETILARINSRIQKIKTGGGNTTEAEKLTVEAKIKIDAAKVSFETLKTEVGNGVNDLSTTTDGVKKENMEKMRNSERTISKNLKEAHLLLEKALGSLRGFSQMRTATSTQTNTGTTTGTN